MSLEEQLAKALAELAAEREARRAAERRVEHLTRLLERLMNHLGVPAEPEAAAAPEPERAAGQAPEPPPRPEREKTARREGHGRAALPASLPRDERVYRPTKCPKCAGEALRELDQEISEFLDYVPAYVRVRRVVRWKCVCKACNTIVTADAPPMPIEKGKCTEAFLAWVLYSKYAMHLPLERLKVDLKRQGVKLETSTMCGWVGQTAELLDPLVRRMKALLLATGVVQTDGTGLKVLQRGKDRAHLGQVAVYCGMNWAIYEYTATKEGKHAAAFLDGFEGTVVADAASTFDQLYRTGCIVEAGCWAHARRKFEDALDHEPRAANEAIAWIGAFYDVERDARQAGVTGAALQALRRERTGPLVRDFRAWLDTQAASALPKSTLGKAVAYCRRHWDALTRFLDDPRLPLDNNLSERCLRAVAVGRNNYIFAGSDAGAESAATIYSIVQSCKLQGVDPLAYLTNVLARLSVHPDNRIRGGDALDALLPHRWKQAAE